MKHFKLSLAICFFLSFVFANNTVKAHPGDSCSSAIYFTSSIIDSIPADSLKWYSFTASDDSMSIIIVDSSISVGHIHTITLFDSCNGSESMQKTEISISNDTLTLYSEAILKSHTYYILLSDTSMGCTRCSAGKAKFKIYLTHIATSYATFSYSIYNDTKCGLNYTMGNVVIRGEIWRG